MNGISKIKMYSRFGAITLTKDGDEVKAKCSTSCYLNYEKEIKMAMEIIKGERK